MEHSQASLEDLKIKVAFKNLGYNHCDILKKSLSGYVQ